MMPVSLEAAQADLDELIERALRGEEVVIALDGVPAVKLEPIREVEGSS